MSARRAVGAVAVVAAAVVALAALVAVAPRPAAAADCAPALPGSTATFTYQGQAQEFRVPEGVSQLTVTARGGHGGEYPETGPGGAGGLVTATVPVTAGECLEVAVGGYGAQPDGGFGHGNGGGQGSVPAIWFGHASAAGGGATALLRAGTPLVAAGGGGGGGGNGNRTIDVAWGGAGGDAGGGDDDRVDGAIATGADGADPKPLPHDQSPLGGPGGGSQHANGEQGDSTGEQPWDPWLGAGGAGGGGYPRGGGAGGVVVAKCPPGYNRCFLLPAGGAGGGGGDSYAAPQARDVQFDVYTDEACPVDGGADACDGRLELDWTVRAGRIAPYGGSGQDAVIGSRFPQPLQARVTAADGQALHGFAVTFALPASGAGARFDEGDRQPATVTVATDERGVATSPPLVANGTAGHWSATASAAGVPDARFGLDNDPAPTATALTSSANPAVSGEPVRFVAQVRSAPTTAPPAQGQVRFTVDGRPLGAPVTLDGFGRAVSAPIAGLAGAVDVEAQYVQSDDFLPSRDTLVQRIERTRSVLTLTSSANPSADGQAVTFDAQVAAVAPGDGEPSGTVRFTVDEVALGPPVALAGGRARSPPVDLDAGEHRVEAVYAGDGEHLGAGSTLTQAVGPDATAVELTATPASAVAGQPVTVTATVRAAVPTATPTGSVTFSPDASTSCDDVALDGAGRASCTLSGPLTPGDHEIVAQYSGDVGFAPSSGRWRQPVLAARTAVALQADPDPSVFGQQLRLHAAVTPVAPGAGAPSGSVVFRVDGVAVGRPVVLRDGRGSSPPLPSPAAGPHLVEVSYSGDASFLPAEDAATQVVDRAATAVTLHAARTGVRAGEPVAFRARVDVAAPGPSPARGRVRFRIDGVARGGPVPVEDGVAISPPVALGAGVHDVRASFVGAAGFAPAEATLAQRVAVGPGGAGGADGGAGAGPGAGGGSQRVPGCARVLALTHVQAAGRRVHLRGIAPAAAAGRRVAIVSRGRVVARARIARDGGFRTSVRRPTARRRSTVRYRARLGRERSTAEALRRRVRIGAARVSAPGVVRLIARVADRRRHRLSLTRRLGCRRRAEAAGRVRTGRRGRVELTLARPSAAEGIALYRVRVDRRRGGTSLPIVVRAARR